MRSGTEHLAGTTAAVASLEHELDRLDGWGRDLASRLRGGNRLLVAGNGGSAAQAQHLTAELVGRYEDERAPLSAIPLHGDTSSLTAIANDYGADDAFARQVRAHGRKGDVLMLLSTSGRSANVVAAARTGRECGLRTLAMTGTGPNALTELCDDAVVIDSTSTAHVQEAHLVAIHLVCAAVDRSMKDVGTR